VLAASPMYSGYGLCATTCATAPLIDRAQVWSSHDISP